MVAWNEQGPAQAAGKGSVMNKRRAFPCAILATVLLLFHPLVLAQESAGSAFGESVNLSLDPVLGPSVLVSSGPFPAASGATPPAFNDADSAASASVDAVVTNNGLPIAVSVLSTGLLEVSTQGDQVPDSASEAEVNNVNLDLLGALVGTLLFGLDADTITATASAGGSCETGLTATGDTVLENATASGQLATVAGVSGAISASPAPNTVLLDVDLGPAGRLTVILNEQIATGDGATSAGITVNAIHVIADGLLFGSIIEIDGDIIISQAVAEVTCEEADLSITKSDSPDPVTAGEDLTYTLTVDNAGPDDADNVVVTDTLPPTASFVSATPSQGSCTHDSGEVVCELGTIANGAGATITIVVTPFQAGQISNTAVVDSDAFDPDDSDNSDTEDTTVDAPPASADLSVVKTDSPDPVTAGANLTYTLTVSNAGPDDASNVEVVDTLPGGVAFVSATPSQGSCGEAAGVVTCDLGTIANGASATVTIVVTTGGPGVITNTVTVDADENDPDPSDNTDSEDTAVQNASPLADLSISKSDSADPVDQGSVLSYLLVVSNAGPDAAVNVEVVDALPPNVTFLSATPSQGSCGHAAGVVTCALGTVGAGASATVTIDVQPAQPGVIVNDVTVDSDTPDPDTSDNADSEETSVNPAPGGGPGPQAIGVPVMGVPGLGVLAALLVLFALGALRRPARR